MYVCIYLSIHLSHIFIFICMYLYIFRHSVTYLCNLFSFALLFKYTSNGKYFKRFAQAMNELCDIRSAVSVRLNTDRKLPNIFYTHAPAHTHTHRCLWNGQTLNERACKARTRTFQKQKNQTRSVSNMTSQTCEAEWINLKFTFETHPVL